MKQVKNNRNKKQKTKKQSNKQKLNRTTATETITNKTKLICSFFMLFYFVKIVYKITRSGDRTHADNTSIGS